MTPRIPGYHFQPFTQPTIHHNSYSPEWLSNNKSNWSLPQYPYIPYFAPARMPPPRPLELPVPEPTLIVMSSSRTPFEIF